MTTTLAFEERLAGSPVFTDFCDHRFFQAVDSLDLTRDQAAVLIEQWWHPLHYFPTFLARAIAVLPDIGSKSAISRILNQETGGGNVGRAHEVIYLESMRRCGFDPDRISNGVPYPETVALVEGYRTSTDSRESALGFIFATETTDLLMVSSIGKAVARATGVTDNEWVAIHMRQEPDHVEQAKHALLSDFTADQARAVLEAADHMWRLWTAFFDRLAIESDVRATAAAR
jgi:pyrroloquinoline quinone (PQQ) biosynthesis protein C